MSNEPGKIGLGNNQATWTWINRGTLDRNWVEMVSKKKSPNGIFYEQYYCIDCACVFTDFFFFGKSILSVSVLLKKKRCVTLQNFVENMSATARFSSYVITFSTRNHVSSVTAALRACYHGSNANFEVSEKTVELGRDWSWLMIDSPRGSIPGKPWIQTLLNGVHILWTNL